MQSSDRRLGANGAALLLFEPRVDAVGVVLVLAPQLLVVLRHLEVFHADQARVALCAARVPEPLRNAIDLRLLIASIHVAIFLAELHELLVCHPVHVGVIWVAHRTRVILGFLDSPLQESLLLGLGLVGPCALVQRHHHHLTFLHPLLHLIKLVSHHHLSFNLLVTVPASASSLARTSCVLASCTGFILGCSGSTCHVAAWPLNTLALALLFAFSQLAFTFLREISLVFQSLVFRLQIYDRLFQVDVVFAEFGDIGAVVRYAFLLDVQLVAECFDLPLRHAQLFEHHLGRT